LDDLINWIKNNLKIVVFLSIGILVFSIFIGLIIGLLSRSKNVSNEKSFQRLVEIEKSIEKNKKLIQSKNKATFLIPPKVDISISDIGSSERLDELSYLLDSLELKRIKLSNLINTRTMGENTTIKPVVFNNEEKAIITIRDKILEP